MPKLGEQFLMLSFLGSAALPSVQIVAAVSECGKQIKRYDNSMVWWNWETELQGYVMPLTKLHKIMLGLDNEA
jgi:hypothetical protein